MTKFYIKLSVFLLPIAAVAITAEWLYRGIPNIYSFKSNYLEQNGENITVLVLGSSHSVYGVNPEYLGKNAFNVANVSQTIKYDIYILEKYIEEMSSLEAIILSISYFSLYAEIEEGNEKWRKYNYSHYFGYSYSSLNDLISINYYSVILSSNIRIALTNIYDYYLMDRFEPAWSLTGWANRYNDNRQIDLNKSGKLAAEWHKTEGAMYDRNLIRLNGMIELCAKHNIKLMLFTPPAWISYRENINETKVNTIANLMETLDIKNKHVRYINLLDDSRFLSNDFFDADHLNHSGAKKLTIILNQELLNF